MRGQPARRPDSGGAPRSSERVARLPASIRGPRSLASVPSTTGATPPMPAWRWPPRWPSSPRCQPAWAAAFLLFYDAGTGRVLGANGCGRAPRAATIEKLRRRGIKEMPEHGGLSVTVPGAARLWEDAVKRLGRLTLSRLLEPAREAAEEGYPVSEVSARYWEDGEGLQERDEAAHATFLLPLGRAPRPGEVFRQPDLARTLAAVTENGADAFYEGEVARSIARSTREAATSTKKISPSTSQRGWSRSTRITAACECTRYRLPARALLPWRC
jgi:Gamma-glutamyltranspeptidase